MNLTQTKKNRLKYLFFKSCFILFYYLLEGCNVDKSKDCCDENFIISHNNYSTFLENKECYNNCEYIAVMRVGKDTLRNILAHFSNSENLNRLSIHSISIDTLSPDLINLKDLKEIKINSSNINYVSNRMKIFNNLVSIDLSSNNIGDLPFINSKLIYVNLSENRLKELPRSLYTQPSLVEINLNNNLLKSIPIDSLSWDNVKKISIYGNRLDSVNIKSLKEYFGEETVVNIQEMVE